MTINRSGYVQIRMPKHPRAGRNGQIAEHTLVMEKKLGRYLLPSEVVHHIDGNKQNNSPENLRLFSSVSEHSKFHGQERRERLRISERINKLRAFNGTKTVSEMAAELGLTRHQCWHTVQDYKIPFLHVKGSRPRTTQRQIDILARQVAHFQRKYFLFLERLDKINAKGFCMNAKGRTVRSAQF